MAEAQIDFPTESEFNRFFINIICGGGFRWHHKVTYYHPLTPRVFARVNHYHGMFGTGYKVTEREGDEVYTTYYTKK